MADMITQAADRTANGVESAVRNHDQTAYSNAMKEVDQYEKTHSTADLAKYSQGITTKLEKDGILPRVALFEARSDFSNIDLNEDGNLQKREISAYKNQRGVNEVRQRLLGEVEDKFDQVRGHYAKFEDGVSRAISGINQNDIDTAVKKSETVEQNQKSLDNLFKKDATGRSLFDRVKDENGGISGDKITHLQNTDSMSKARSGLTDQDRETLKLLNQNRPATFKHPIAGGDIDKDALKTLCKENGVEYDKVNSGEASDRKQALCNLFKKDDKGVSVYDMLKDNDGHIRPDAVQELRQLGEQEPGELKLTDQVKASLKLLETSSKPNDLKEEDIQKLCKDNGLNYDELKAGKLPKLSADTVVAPVAPARPADAAVAPARLAATTETPAAVHPPRDAATIAAEERHRQELAAAREQAARAEAIKQHEAAIKEALTVRKGESYWHCAERLLSLAGNNDPAGQQIRRFAHQLWVADGRKEANGLNTKDVLKVSDEIKKNKDVAKLFS